MQSRKNGNSKKNNSDSKKPAAKNIEEITSKLLNFLKSIEKQKEKKISLLQKINESYNGGGKISIPFIGTVQDKKIPSACRRQNEINEEIKKAKDNKNHNILTSIARLLKGKIANTSLAFYTIKNLLIPPEKDEKQVKDPDEKLVMALKENLLVKIRKELGLKEITSIKASNESNEEKTSSSEDLKESSFVQVKQELGSKEITSNEASNESKREKINSSKEINKQKKSGNKSKNGRKNKRKNRRGGKRITNENSLNRRKKEITENDNQRNERVDTSNASLKQHGQTFFPPNIPEDIIDSKKRKDLNKQVEDATEENASDLDVPLTCRIQ